MGYGNLGTQILLNELPTDERDLFSMISTSDPEAYQRASDLMYAIQGGNKERGTGSPYARLREMAYVGQLRGQQDALAEQKAEAIRRAMNSLQTFGQGQQPMSREEYLAQMGQQVIPPEQRQDYLGRWGAEMSAKAGRGETFTNEDLIPYELAGVRSKPEAPKSRQQVMLELSQAGVPPEVIKAMLPEPKDKEFFPHPVINPATGKPEYAYKDKTFSGLIPAPTPENPEKIEREAYGKTLNDYRSEMNHLTNLETEARLKEKATGIPYDPSIILEEKKRVVNKYKDQIKYEDLKNPFGYEGGQHPQVLTPEGEVPQHPALLSPQGQGMSPKMQGWLTQARQANPNVSEEELIKYYKQKYGE